MTESGTSDGNDIPTSPSGAAGAMLIIISGPSGVGKDTIIDALRLRRHEPEYHYVVTCTTRAMRPGEADGIDYHFLDKATFAAQRAAGEFLEANQVHGNWYGTPRSQRFGHFNMRRHRAGLLAGAC